MKFHKIERLFFNILNYSFLLPVLSFVLFFNKLRFKRVAIVIVIYSVIIFLLLFFDDFLSDHYRKEYSTFYTTIEYLCFTYIIAEIIRDKPFKILMLVLSILFILFELLVNFSLRQFHRIDSVPIGIETILILIYAFFLFYEQFKVMETGYIYSKHWFWFVTGILFYLSSSFFFNILASNNIEIAGRYWYLTWIFETIKNILFVVGIILLAIRQVKDKNSSSIPYLDMV